MYEGLSELVCVEKEREGPGSEAESVNNLANRSSALLFS